MLLVLCCAWLTLGSAPNADSDLYRVDIWTTLEPFYDLLTQYSAQNQTIASASTGGLCAAWHRASRTPSQSLCCHCTAS